MDIRSSVDGLKTLLGVSSSKPAETQPAKREAGTTGTPFASDHATVSSAGSEVAQFTTDSDVPMDKVAEVQAVLAAGTYNVPASAVAGLLRQIQGHFLPLRYGLKKRYTLCGA